MPTGKPRLNVVLEPPLYHTIKELAEKDGMSLSLKARDLIKEALEVYEDSYWLRKAKEREASFNKDKALTHEEVWK